MDRAGFCRGYCGPSCTDGSCPAAMADVYAEVGMDVVRSCGDCYLYRGCSDCIFEGTDVCRFSLGN